MNDKKGEGLHFSEFPPTSRDLWMEKVMEDLRGADFSRKLVWKTQEGFEVDPFYTREDGEKLDYLNYFHNLTLNQEYPQDVPRPWILYEKIKVGSEKKANSDAQSSFHMGSNGANFMLEDSTRMQLNVLLNNIYPNINPAKFSLKGHVLDFLSKYLDFISKQDHLDLSDIHGGLDFDPLMIHTTGGNFHLSTIAELADCIRMSAEISEFRPLTIHGSHFHNAGVNAAEEIALITSAAVAYLDILSSKGIGTKEFLSSFEFSLAVGTNYFMEIAKIRALRILFYHIVRMYGIKDLQPDAIFIHGSSSVWTKTIYDPYVNILRNTTEVMAALLGGCNSISIAAFDEVFRKPSEFSKRISRNISNLLKEESYLDRVADPAAGSYYIETLTDKLVESSLSIFKEIDARGGYLKALDKGIIGTMARKSREIKFELASTRRNIFIGTNQYPNLTESVDPDEIRIKEPSNATDPKFLNISRGAVHFENLRLATDRYVKIHGENKRPTVFLSLIGDNKVMRKARAAFSSGFFGCAGYKLIESNPSPDLFKAVQKAIESNAGIVVMCGADEDYLSGGIDYATAYKANCNGILVIAGNPEEKIRELKDAGVDEFINLRTNLIESLYQFQNRLNIINQ